MPQSADVNQVQATKTFSLLKRAVLWLLVLVVVLAVVAGIYSYHTSYHEVSDFQKDNLKNIALLIVEHENDDEDIQHTQHRHYRTEDQDGGLLIDVLKKEHKKEKERKNNEATDKEYIEKLKQFKTNHNEEKMKRISYQRRCTSLMNKLDTETEKNNVLTDLIKGTFLNILNGAYY